MLIAIISGIPQTLQANVRIVGLPQTRIKPSLSTFCQIRYSVSIAIIRRYIKLKTKLRGLSPRANYTDRATAACQRSDCHLLQIETATWSA
jgi:hypothetical protein